MPHALDVIMIRSAAALNVTVFRLSHGRARLYKSWQLPRLKLTQGEATTQVSYLPDGPTYIVFAAPWETNTTWATNFYTAGRVHIEIGPSDSRAIVMTGGTPEEREATRRRFTAAEEARRHKFNAVVTPVTSDAERTALTKRLLKRASFIERYDARDNRLTPIARLTPTDS